MLGVSKESKKDEKMNGIFYNLVSFKYHCLVYYNEILRFFWNTNLYDSRCVHVEISTNMHYYEGQIYCDSS